MCDVTGTLDAADLDWVGGKVGGAVAAEGLRVAGAGAVDTAVGDTCYGGNVGVVAAYNLEGDSAEGAVSSGGGEDVEGNSNVDWGDIVADSRSGADCDSGVGKGQGRQGQSGGGVRVLHSDIDVGDV